AAQSLAAPTGLTATTYSKAIIDLAWDDPNPALSGVGEAGYIVERSKGTTCCSFTKVFTSGPDVTSWSSTGLSTGTTYFYRVRASNALGDSPPSNVATATTKPDLTPPTVAISGPAAGTIYTTPQTVTITAAASDNVQVAKVEFYDGGVLQATATTAPFTHA